MGTSNSGRFASSSGIFLGLDRSAEKRMQGKRRESDGSRVTACFTSDQIPIKGNRDGIKERTV